MVRIFSPQRAYACRIQNRLGTAHAREAKHTQVVMEGEPSRTVLQERTAAAQKRIGTQKNRDDRKRIFAVVARNPEASRIFSWVFCQRQNTHIGVVCARIFDKGLQYGIIAQITAPKISANGNRCTWGNVQVFLINRQSLLADGFGIIPSLQQCAAFLGTSFLQSGRRGKREDICLQNLCVRFLLASGAKVGEGSLPKGFFF